MDHQEAKFVSLRNDLLFHMVFTRNMEALKSLVSVLISIPAVNITQIEVLNPMQYSETLDTKLTVLDLKVHLNAERYVLVEMQVRRFAYWTNRTIAYACRQMADQVSEDFQYSRLEPVIQISILDHTLFPDHARFFAKYSLRDKEGYSYSDKLQFYVLDLTQIGKAAGENADQGLIAWAEAFRASSWEEVERIEDSGVKEAAKTMQTILSDPAERELIRRRMDARNDWVTLISSAHEEGIEEGIGIGREEGIGIGRKEGIGIGREEGIGIGREEGIGIGREEGIGIGRKEGIDIGQMIAFSGLVRDGILTVQDAARRMGISELEFEKQASFNR